MLTNQRLLALSSSATLAVPVVLAVAQSFLIIDALFLAADPPSSHQ
jgi:hypothetical protein